MKPRKKGQQFEISYRCPGYDKPVSERFATLDEANVRCAEIELARARGELRPPTRTAAPAKMYLTVSELLDEYVRLYGLNHWGDSYLSYSRHRIEHYIKPFLGDYLVKDLTTHDVDVFYDQLLVTPAIVTKGHKDTGKTVSTDVIKKVQRSIRRLPGTISLRIPLKRRRFPGTSRRSGMFGLPQKQSTRWISAWMPC